MEFNQEECLALKFAMEQVIKGKMAEDFSIRELHFLTSIYVKLDDASEKGLNPKKAKTIGEELQKVSKKPRHIESES